jgi:hypothetical protein
LNPERISSKTSEDNLPIITKSDITNKIQKLKKNSICPVDIRIALIKSFSDKISEPLVDIFNKIRKTGKFQVPWKQGYVTPVPKKGAVVDFDKVIPITLTSLFSKLYKSFLSDLLRVLTAERIEIRQL